jgi:hypothetical protein
LRFRKTSGCHTPCDYLLLTALEFFGRVSHWANQYSFSSEFTLRSSVVHFAETPISTEMISRLEEGHDTKRSSVIYNYISIAKKCFTIRFITKPQYIWEIISDVSLYRPSLSPDSGRKLTPLSPNSKWRRDLTGISITCHISQKSIVHRSAINVSDRPGSFSIGDKRTWSSLIVSDRLLIVSDSLWFIWREYNRIFDRYTIGWANSVWLSISDPYAIMHFNVEFYVLYDLAFKSTR